MGSSGKSGGTSSPLTTKGDLWGYSTANARIPVGADALGLLADSTQTLGLKWGTVSTFINPMNALGDTMYGIASGVTDLANNATVISDSGHTTDPPSNMFTGGGTGYWGSNNLPGSCIWQNNTSGAVTQIKVNFPDNAMVTGMAFDYSTVGSSGPWTNSGVTGQNPANGLNTYAITATPTNALFWRVTFTGFSNAAFTHMGRINLNTTGTIAGTATRLPIGSTNQVLTVVGGVPAWAASAVTWPLTNSGDENFQPNGIAINALGLHSNASAINGLTITATATGSAPTIAASGSDTNVGITLNPQAAGTITIGGKADAGIPLTVAGNSTTQTGDLLDIYQNAGGNPLFKFATASSATNGITFSAKATTVVPTIAAAGGDTNIGLKIDGKGSGSINIGATSTGLVQLGASSSTTQQVTASVGSSSSFTVSSNNSPFNTLFTVANVASAANGATLTCTAAGSSPSIAAAGTDTNIDLTIAGKNTGVINYGYASTAISGATPATLATGTGGATGPATAAQNAWLAVKINGTTSYVPFWR